MISGCIMKKRTKKTLSVAGQVLLRLLLATVLCGILFLSMMAIATGMFSDVVGYQIHEEQKDGTIKLIEEKRYADGEKPVSKSDLKLTDDQVFTPIREVPPQTLAVFNGLAQVMMLVVLAIFPYHIAWQFGNRDDTNVRYKGQRPDPWRGYRIGAFASVPYAVLWVLLLVAKFGLLPESYTQVYRLATIPFMPYVQWVMPAASLQDTAIWQLLLLLPMLLYVPIVCGISYRLGHKQFSIREHLVFASKKENADEEI